MRRAWLLWLVLLPGCASIPVRAPEFPAAELARADRLVSEGCYTCLIEARDTLTGLTAGPYRPVVLQRLLEVQWLIVLRHKELAMPATGALAEANRTADELLLEPVARRYRSLVDAVAEDVAGVTERERTAFVAAHRDMADGIPAETRWLDEGPLGQRFGTYLSLALECAWKPPSSARPAVRTTAPPVTIRVLGDDPPLLRYRRAICDEPDLENLEVVRALAPEFHEAGYYQALSWLQNVQKYGFAKPATTVLEIQPRFPLSPSVLVTAAGIQRSRSLCEEALGLYTQALALRPGHENALLGRTECLSRLQRHDAAIEEATTLIGLGGRNLAAAYYWRAWNQHKLDRLPPARQDIEAGKRALRQPDATFQLLAGVIEYDQDDLDPATSDLRAAVGFSMGRACLAHSYLGLVSVKRKTWAQAAGYFETAVRCYRQDIDEATAELSALERATDVAADFKAARIAQLGRLILEGEKHRREAAINGAKMFVAVGDFTAAVRLGQIAMDDPALSAEVKLLRDYLVEVKSPVLLPETVATPN
jgi:tetratricopeptide (TPR) repeat protein